MRLRDSRNAILFVGYQAPGTRGRPLVDGAGEVRIHGQMVRVAARIAQLDSMSTHADRRGILRWLKTMPEARGAIWLIHGEPPAARDLQELLAGELHTPVGVAQDGQQVEVTGRVGTPHAPAMIGVSDASAGQTLR